MFQKFTALKLVTDVHVCLWCDVNTEAVRAQGNWVLTEGGVIVGGNEENYIVWSFTVCPQELLLWELGGNRKYTQDFGLKATGSGDLDINRDGFTVDLENKFFSGWLNCFKSPKCCYGCGGPSGTPRTLNWISLFGFRGWRLISDICFRDSLAHFIKRRCALRLLFIWITSSCSCRAWSQYSACPLLEPRRLTECVLHCFRGPMGRDRPTRETVVRVKVALVVPPQWAETWRRSRQVWGEAASTEGVRGPGAPAPTRRWGTLPPWAPQMPPTHINLR
jgi:hypothetical protein